MGRYIAVGIVSKIVIPKYRNKVSNLTLDLLLPELNKELNINCYNFTEDQEKYSWEINPLILEENLVEFLEQQFKIYDEDKYFQKTLLELNSAKSFSEIIELALSKDLDNFQMIDEIISCIKVGDHNDLSKYLDVYYSMIAYFLEVKVIIEEHLNIFKYLEKIMRLQRKKYPIVDCCKIMLTS